jgi:hypothetical protein
VTVPERAASKGAAPGRSTSSELVQVYRILVDAGEPLTVPQIVERFPRTGFVSAAMQEYAKHKAGADPTWLEGKGDRWSNAAQAEAMIWWVRKIVRLACQTKILNVTSKSTQNAAGRVREGTYEPGKPPKVQRRVWVEKTAVVDWSPELETELTRGHSAGMEFIAQLDGYRRKSKPSAATKALLDLAERAIRAQQ